jgi:hypothetical protein
MRLPKWVWVFLVLGLLGAAAISISWVYNVRQQLTLEELNHNRDLWQKEQPRDYVMEFTKVVGEGNQRSEESFITTVRDGRVRSVVRRQVTKTGPYEKALDPDQYGSYTMDALFDAIDRLMQVDSEKGHSRVHRAIFDAQNGRLVYYLHGGGAGEPRLEISVTRFEAGSSSPPSSGHSSRLKQGRRSSTFIS